MKSGKREYVRVVSSQYAVTVRLNPDISKEECIVVELANDMSGLIRK